MSAGGTGGAGAAGGPGGVDVVVVGQVGRDLVLAVEALPGPGASAPVRRRQEVLGGKGANQAVAAAQLGATAALVGVVGRDAPGEAVLGQAARDGIDVGGVVRRDGETALLVDVVEEDGTRRLLEDVPAPMLLTPADVAAATGTLTGARAVLVQLQQPAAAVRTALRLAAAGPGLVVADGAAEDEELRADLLRTAGVLRADAHEAELLVGRELADPGAVADAARELREAGPAVVVLDAGSRGNVVAWEGGCELVPLVDVPAADPTGGGDTFVAAVSIALLSGRSPLEAARWASAAAALTVLRTGGRPGLSVAAVDELLAAGLRR